MDTIVGIATALSQSGISIIRISGEKAIDIANQIFRCKKLNSLKDAESHYLYYGFIYDNSNNNIMDEVLVSIMKAPHSYTCEDVVEINCHGGILITKKIFDIIVRNGASVAPPGEFTKRAYLNGRIDLTQAEAVMDIISSDNDYALRSSIEQLKGNYKVKIDKIRHNLLDIIGEIESALDDPENYFLQETQNRFSEELRCNCKVLESLIASYDNGKLIKDGIKTVLLGKPNVGKSSILNFLSGYERAIVTDIAGTTRDAIYEHINIDGINLILCDTAGINNSDDVIEMMGVNISLSLIENSDLCLFVCDSSKPLDENDKKIIEKLAGKKVIILFNKIDLKEAVSEDLIEKTMIDAGHMDKDFQIIKTSVVDEYGFDNLKVAIKNMFDIGDIEKNNEVIITSLRQKECLSLALDRLKNSLGLFMTEDILSMELMAAYDDLSHFLGEEVDDDYINHVFENFCMGK